MSDCLTQSTLKIGVSAREESYESPFLAEIYYYIIDKSACNSVLGTANFLIPLPN